MNARGRFLIVSWDGGGNVPPAVNLAARLVDRGHQVRVLGWDTMAERVAAAGAEFATYPSVPPWPPDLGFEAGWDDRMIPALESAATRDDIVAAARSFRPDALVVDCMMPSAFHAARLVGRPSAALVHLLLAAWSQEWPEEPLRSERAAMLAEMRAVLALVPPGFEADLPVMTNARYVGPITGPKPLPPLAPEDGELFSSTGDPWVLLSLSTTLQGQAQVLPGLLEALAPLSVRVLLTLGGVLPVSAVHAPSNVTVRGFVPHDLVLPHMTLTISHGGLSTIMASLTAGVPIVCAPQGRDQHDNAARVVATGVGRVVSPEPSTTELRSAVRELLADDAARRGASIFAERIAALGRGEVAADLVETLLDPVLQGRGDGDVAV
jgi:UDP:flavonoid glycosyltransferase YjiC (YdhE family)